MQKRAFISLLLPLLILFAWAPPAHAVDIKAEGSEWMAVNSSNVQVTVTFAWTDLTFNRVERATRIIPPKGKVRICPVAGNTEPKPAGKR